MLYGPVPCVVDFGLQYLCVYFGRVTGMLQILLLFSD